MRRIVKKIIDSSELEELDDKMFPVADEVSDIWNFQKDGKMWFDPKEYPKGMRK